MNERASGDNQTDKPGKKGRSERARSHIAPVHTYERATVASQTCHGATVGVCRCVLGRCGYVFTLPVLQPSLPLVLVSVRRHPSGQQVGCRWSRMPDPLDLLRYSCEHHQKLCEMLHVSSWMKHCCPHPLVNITPLFHPWDRVFFRSHAS